MFNTNDFKQYRHSLGFSSQQHFKEFLSAKDIKPRIDFAYIDSLNSRLCEIFKRINEIYYKPCDIEFFLQNNLFNAFNLMKNNDILEKLNNQGRRKEEVYFSYLRGFLICEYFKEAMCDIFDIDISQILHIGEDDFSSLETFKRTPKADLQIQNIRIEMQSGFQGINDIKEHKVREAKRNFIENKIQTLVIHFDIFNGQVAFVDISNIPSDDLNWITRQQMEGQSVFNIEQNYFKWLLKEKPPKFDIKELKWEM
ncbi:restriction endonuclease [Campylobacter upsaliensis]|uniref:Restriction endonuclease n=1 Tax=Campylobacter upsaliensis TaxID=28080 RepID=A0A5L4QAN2_CAMUP|nr:restriction endonuclease [Campylobacter upsaliensis]EAH6026024.1 restriction endonuclease [Campylobacter upsaliensis]EAH6029318.1 restriction endonuclease [Campylobacter upsaliensis]EAI2900072.1 restriction endonuclease [Campylobacter upsaliensis]EAI4617174.1 restriction endonuclease [Campylobacter upsaliensis]EAI7264053.1 restriction endonuclease [Campylobacter upsaliensis]